MVMPFAENGSALAYLRGGDVGATHCPKIVSTCFSHRNTIPERILLYSVDGERARSVAPSRYVAYSHSW